MVISSFISSLLILALGIWAYMKLESSMNIVAEKQLLIEPSKFSYKMWKDMPVSMYQSFTFFNLTNWNQVKSVGQKPRFVEVGPYVYRTIWSKSDVNFMEDEKLVSFAEKKQWIFQPHLSRGSEDDQIWTINTPLMTALALIQNAPVITRNIVSVILDGLGEGAFIKRNIRSLLFEGYSDLIVSVGPLFDRRFANFNGKFAYLYNKNDSVDGLWTVSTGTDDLSTLNKIVRFQSNIVNMTGQAPPQGLNEVKPECAPAWSLDQSSNGQLFSPFNRELEQLKLQQQLQQIKSSPKTARSDPGAGRAGQQVVGLTSPLSSSPLMVEAPAPKRFFSRSLTREHQQDMVPNPFMSQRNLQEQSRHQALASAAAAVAAAQSAHEKPLQARDLGKFIFYPDLCRPIHLLPSRHEISTPNGIKANRYYIDPRVFMNSTQIPTNRCYEMNPRPPLTNALAATINSVTGANVAMPNLVTGASSPFAMFSPPSLGHHGEPGAATGRTHERPNHPASFLNNALQSLGGQDLLASSSSANGAPVSRLGRVRQLFSNIVSQRMSAAGPGSLLPSLAAGPAGLLMGGHFPHGAASNARNSLDDPQLAAANLLAARQPVEGRQATLDGLAQGSNPLPVQSTAPAGGSDRWITQFRFKWPRGVFSIGQCQLGAPIYASLPHFLDADEYYLEQVDGLKPNRSLHEFYIDIESTLHSIPVGAKARLQLNVATPELRFRNIPNAMIPVLWQEVTFEIDKPVATLLYWSFTMSPTLYALVSWLLLLLGSASLLMSFAGCYREHRHRRNKVAELETPPRGPVTSSGSLTVAGGETQLEGQRSSWQPHMMLRTGMQQVRSNLPAAGDHLHRLGRHLSARSPSNSSSSRISPSSQGESLDELRHGAALNRAFSSSHEFHDRLSDNGLHHHHHHHNLHLHQQQQQQREPVSGPSSSSTFTETSPKQPSSRASSHCELVSSLGQTVNCAGCLLACLRHSPNNGAHIHDQHRGSAGASDSSLVRKHCNNADKVATLSSRESNLDTCSSIYTQRTRTFKSEGREPSPVPMIEL